MLGEAFRTGTFVGKLTDGEDSDNILSVHHKVVGCLIPKGHLPSNIKVN